MLYVEHSVRFPANGATVPHASCLRSSARRCFDPCRPATVVVFCRVPKVQWESCCMCWHSTAPVPAIDDTGTLHRVEQGVI